MFNLVSIPITFFNRSFCKTVPPQPLQPASFMLSRKPQSLVLSWYQPYFENGNFSVISYTAFYCTSATDVICSSTVMSTQLLSSVQLCSYTNCSVRLFIDGLSSGTTYFFKVAAVNALGTSMKSSVSNPITTPTSLLFEV